SRGALSGVMVRLLAVAISVALAARRAIGDSNFIDRTCGELCVPGVVRRSRTALPDGARNGSTTPVAARIGRRVVTTAGTRQFSRWQSVGALSNSTRSCFEKKPLNEKHHARTRGIIGGDATRYLSNHRCG